MLKTLRLQRTTPLMKSLETLAWEWWFGPLHYSSNNMCIYICIRVYGCVRVVWDIFRLSFSCLPSFIMKLELFLSSAFFFYHINSTPQGLLVSAFVNLNPYGSERLSC